jgi:hypothetical protein
MSWFLTSEGWPFGETEGRFERVIPKRDSVFGRRGWGVWEVAAR